MRHTLIVFGYRLRKLCLWLLSIPFFHPSAFAQSPLPDFKFERIAMEHGLSHGTVTDIVQDSSGFIWIGTADGLNRFDGRSFKIFKHNPKDAHSISSSFVRTLFVDRSGTLWIAAYNAGLNKFDRVTEKFTRYVHNPHDPSSLSHNTCGWLAEDTNGILWIGTDNGLDALDPKSGRFTHFRHNSSDRNSLRHNVIVFLFRDKQGMLWVGTTMGLDKLDPATGLFTHYDLDPSNPAAFGNLQVWSIYEDRSGVLWIGTHGSGLFRFNQVTGHMKHYRHDPLDPHSLSHNIVFKVFEDLSGLLWVGTDGGGLNVLDRTTDRFFHFKHDPQNSHSLSHNNASVALEDKHGTLWISTWGGGVNKLSRFKQKFRHYQNDPDNRNSLSNNFVFSFAEDRSGALWIGTLGGGLNRFDRTTGRFTHFKHNPSTKNGLTDNHIWTLLTDSEGILWIGTETGGLNRFNPRTQEWTSFRHVPSVPFPKGWIPTSLSENEIRSILESRRKSGRVLWIGTGSKGLNKFDVATGKSVRYTHDPNDSTSLGIGSVWTLCEGRNGTLWIGTSRGGLNRLDEQTGKFVRYVHNPSNPNSLSHNDVRTIHEDASGTLWIGTFGGGLNRFDRTTEQFTVFTEQDGLANNFIYGILEDEDGSFWISTNRGVSKFDPRRGVFKNYAVQDGLQADEFNTGAYLKTRNGEMLFGGVNGFNRFHPRQVQDNPHVPSIVLVSIAVKGKPLSLDTSITEIRHIELAHDDNFFSFEFAALDFVDPSRNRYAYKLEGLDDDWVYNGTRNYASYTNVEHGDYVFRAKGSNSDGVWNEQGLSVSIRIIPPFYRQAWFQAAALLMAAALFGGIIWFLSVRKLRQQVRRLEQEKLMEAERQRTRARIARDLHDDISSTLGSIALYAESLRRQASQLSRKHSDTLAKISGLSTEALDAMSDIVWSIAPQHDSLNNLLARIKNLAVSTCALSRIDYEIDIPECQHEVNLSEEVRRNLYLIFKEALNNILRHSSATAVKIKAGLHNDTFEMILEDNGKGFLINESELGLESTQAVQSEKRSTGHGLCNMRNRAKEIDAELVITSEQGKGTTVQLVKRMT